MAIEIRPYAAQDLTPLLAAMDGDRLVGTATALSLQLTIPGGQVAAAGVTAVGGPADPSAPRDPATDDGPPADGRRGRRRAHRDALGVRGSHLSTIRLRARDAPRDVRGAPRPHGLPRPAGSGGDHPHRRSRRGGGPKQFAVHEVDGAAEGYAIYRIHPGWNDQGPNGKLEAREVIATTPPATRELWRYLFDVDLMTRIRGVLRHRIPHRSCCSPIRGRWH